MIKALCSQRNVLVIRKVGTTLKDSVFKLFKDMLKKWGIISYCKINKSSYDMELPNGSSILFKGLDDSEKVKSITDITDIWIEEATELVKTDFEQLDLRLRKDVEHLQMFLTFNPISKINWCYKYWFENPPAEAKILKTTYKDNPFLPESYIASLEAMKDTNPVYYKIYAEGEFCTLDKLVYNNWRLAEDEDKPTGTMVVGLDFGYVNDPSALVVSYVDDDNKRLYVTDCVTQKGLLNDAIADLIKYKALQKEVIIADSAEQKSIEEIKQLGVPRIRPATKGAGSVNQGIGKLQQYEIIVNPSCTDVITELQNYSYVKDKTTGEYTNTPIDAFNHCLTGDTLVDLEHGQTPIRDLVGHNGSVWSWNEETQTAELHNFSNVRMTGIEDIYRIRLEDGREIKCSAEHPIMTRRGWVNAANLTTEDEILDIGFKPSKA